MKLLHTVTQQCISLCILSLLTAPSINVTINGGTATAGSEYTLTCTVAGVDVGSASTVTYRWSRRGTMLSTSRQYVIPSAQVTDAGDDYLCEVTVTAGYLDVSNSISASATGTLHVQSEHSVQEIISSFIVSCYILQYLNHHL